MPKPRALKLHRKDAWNAFSRYIRKRDSVDADYAICCTCNKPYPNFGVGCIQAGHFIPGRRNAILFDERGVHAQCYNCNVNLKGNWPNYYEFMLKKYGREVIDELIIQKRQTVIYTREELDEIRDKYKKKYEEL